MNCIIVHGSDKNDRENIRKYNLLPPNKRNWFSWLKRELEKKDMKIFTPLMPNNENPLYKEWKNKFEKLPLDKNTILIGQSLGGAFLVRWLGETNQKIKKLILVAPAKFSRNFVWLKDFLTFEIKSGIKKNIGKIVIFTSDNDNPNILKSVKLYHKKLGGKLIELKGRGHFIFKHMGTDEFPELLEEVLK